MKTILHSFLPLWPRLLSHSFMLPFSISSPFCLLFSSFPSPSPSSCWVLFSSVASSISVLPSISVLLHSFLPAACQLLTLALIVSRLQSQEGGSTGIKDGRTWQIFSMPQYTEDIVWPCQNQSDFHSSLNPVCIGLWRCLVCLNCMSEGLHDKH